MNHQPSQTRQARKAFEHLQFGEITERKGVFFVLSVISSGKRTALPVRAPTCTHTVMSAPACVSLRMCGAHTCLSEQRKWLTEKNVANSNFNCQRGKKGEGRQRVGVGWGDVIFMGSAQMNRGEEV